MARLRDSWRTSLPVAQQPRNPQSESIARTPYEIEITIRTTIQEIRLARPQPTLTHVVERVHARCLERNLPRPHRRTIQARLVTVDQRERDEG